MLPRDAKVERSMSAAEHTIRSAAPCLFTVYDVSLVPRKLIVSQIFCSATPVRSSVMSLWRKTLVKPLLDSGVLRDTRPRKNQETIRSA